MAIHRAALWFCALGCMSAPVSSTVEPLAERAVHDQMPLAFEVNQGQTASSVDFLVRTADGPVFLTPSGPTFVFQPGDAPVGAALRLELLDGRRIRGEGVEPLAGKVNYFRGSQPADWLRNVPTYGRVIYRDVYPRIDLVYRGTGHRLEYDFVVHPGGDPSSIAMRIAGAHNVTENGGELVIATAAGELRQAPPVLYQTIGGERRVIPGGVQLEPDRFGFWTGAYDREHALVIDPLVYSTYLGGSRDEEGAAIEVDAAGNAYVVGSTLSPDFPTTPGAFDTTIAGTDVFVTKIDPTGSTLVYSTFLGGSNQDGASGLVVDPAGFLYVTGQTISNDFPVTPGAFDTTYNGSADFFVTELDPTGSALVFSTYIGGLNSDQGRGLALDVTGLYVLGRTGSPNQPTTPLAFDTTFNGGLFDGWVGKLSLTGSTLLYGTFLGGSDREEPAKIEIDALGEAHVTGFTDSTDFPVTPLAFDTTLASTDGFVTKLDALGSMLVYSTFLGGSAGDFATDIDLDIAGNAFISGFTNSSDFPTTPGAFDVVRNGGDAFVSKLDPSGSALVYSTFLGGTGNENVVVELEVDAGGRAWVSGHTNSSNFPVTPGAFDTTANGAFDLFFTLFNSTATALDYSTYLGGNNSDERGRIAIDGVNAYLTGFTLSADFPTTPGAFDTTYNGAQDAFVSKIAAVAAPATVTVAPATATNPVDTQHCVTATVRDVAGNPVPGVTVRFMVTGSVTVNGEATTDANGEAVFCYQGPPLPGADVITAHADIDDDGTQDPGEPVGTGAKAWVLPDTTPLCEVRINDGGWIVAANGDQATFGGNARADSNGAVSGQQEYQDHGPAQPMNVHSIEVLALVCQGSTDADVYGEATIDGGGIVFYRIRVHDAGEPSAVGDRYGILLSNGYASGDQPLHGGNIQVRRD